MPALLKPLVAGVSAKGYRVQGLKVLFLLARQWDLKYRKVSNTLPCVFISVYGLSDSVRFFNALALQLSGHKSLHLVEIKRQNTLGEG